MQEPDTGHDVIDKIRIREFVYRNKEINNRKSNIHIKELKKDHGVSQEQS